VGTISADSDGEPPTGLSPSDPCCCGYEEPSPEDDIRFFEMGSKYVFNEGTSLLTGTQFFLGEETGGLRLMLGFEHVF
jgi:hypothetical protein